MDSIQNSEWMLVMALMVHLIMAPFTKVEESFNVQAMHDILYHRLNLTRYDHLEFPGVVPRTFAAPLLIASIVSPVTIIMNTFNVPKYWTLFAVRFTIGFIVILALGAFCRSISKHFGNLTATFLRLIIVSQFHLLFYASRPLPNTFALIGVLFVYSLLLEGSFVQAVRIATLTTVIFRCELVLLFAPVFIYLFASRRLKITSAIWNGLWSAIVALAVTVPFDSLLWSRFVWPEGEVWWFNVILNRSHEYGVSDIWRIYYNYYAQTHPYFWYWYSALPRLLMASSALIPIGLLFDRQRLLPLLLPSFLFVIFYSFLPHKEVRFIIYVVPTIDVAAAVICARTWINRHKSLMRHAIALIIGSHLFINVIASAFFLYASSLNYPGGQALAYLQTQQRFDRAKPITVHIDVFAAQTGISRFLHLYDSWEYNKTENLSIDERARFDFLIVGSSKNLTIEVAKYASTHRLSYAIGAFHKVHLQHLRTFPYLWPNVRIRERVAVLSKL